MERMMYERICWRSWFYTLSIHLMVDFHVKFRTWMHESNHVFNGASEREAGLPVVCSFGGMLVKRFVKFKSQLTFIRSPKSVMPLVSTQTSVGSRWKNSPPEGMESIDIRLSARQLLLGMLSLLIYTKCWSANNLPFSHKCWMTYELLTTEMPSDSVALPAQVNLFALSAFLQCAIIVNWRKSERYKLRQYRLYLLSRHYAQV